MEISTFMRLVAQVRLNTSADNGSAVHTYDIQCIYLHVMSTDIASVYTSRNHPGGGGHLVEPAVSGHGGQYLRGMSVPGDGRMILPGEDRYGILRHCSYTGEDRTGIPQHYSVEDRMGVPQHHAGTRTGNSYVFR